VIFGNQLFVAQPTFYGSSRNILTLFGFNSNPPSKPPTNNPTTIGPKQHHPQPLSNFSSHSKVSHKTLQIQQTHKRTRNIPNSYEDPTKAEQKLGFKANINIQKGYQCNTKHNSTKKIATTNLNISFQQKATLRKFRESNKLTI
jgi:hypothetical protein